MDLEKPTINDAFRILHQKAHEFVSDRQEYLQNEYSFGQFDRYSVDEVNQQVEFFLAEKPILRMSYQVIGEIDPNSSVWTWQWNKEDLPDQEKMDLEVIKNYGEFYDFELLTIPSWKAEMADAWAVSAVSAYLRGAMGIFRLQLSDSRPFVYFKEVLL